MMSKVVLQKTSCKRRMHHRDVFLSEAYNRGIEALAYFQAFLQLKAPGCSIA